MNLLFDFQHPVDVNFFKESIRILKSQGHYIVLTYRSRGRLGEIIHYEMGDIPNLAIGIHGKSFFSKILNNLYREYKLLSIYKRYDINLTIGFGPLATISSKIYGIPSLVFDDDYEYKINFYYAKLFASRHIIPGIFPVKGRNVVYFNGFKELSYLHPNYFNPMKESLKKHGVSAEEYVFIREISGISLNYSNGQSILMKIVDFCLLQGFKIVLSLEDKTLLSMYKEKCYILNEPVNNIHSILYYARFVVTSGDTMAREAALLGVPTIFTGGRTMLINKELENMGLIKSQTSIKEIESTIHNILDTNEKTQNQNKIRLNINSIWDDTTEVVLKNINDFI